jgi:hypothetical protein
MGPSKEDVGFSPTISPEQLERWLLLEYGDAYKKDIGKLKGRWFTANGSV